MIQYKGGFFTQYQKGSPYYKIKGAAVKDEIAVMEEEGP